MTNNQFITGRPYLVFAIRVITLIFSVLGVGIMFHYYGFVRELVYFTNQSNIFVAVMFLVLVCGDVYYLFVQKRGENYHINAWVECAITMYIFITLVGYWGMLSWQGFSMGTKADAGMLAKVLLGSCNYIVHGVVPLLAIMHWVLFAPHRRSSYKMAPIFIIYPTLYMVYVMVRARFGGPIYGDVYYPYPFFDYHQLGWYFVLVSVVAVTFFVALGAGFIWLDGKLATRIEARNQAKLDV